VTVWYFSVLLEWSFMMESRMMTGTGGVL